MLNVLLVEDNRDLAETVVDYLALEHVNCDYADNGLAGLQLIGRNQYDVLLLDLNLPQLDGLRLCERIRALGNDIPVLMLTARDQLSDKVTGFAVGTDDYLVKPFELQELVVRIRALAKRRSGQVRVLRCGDLEMNIRQRIVTRAGQQVRLSPTGWLLLELLLRASPEVVSRQKLIAGTWGDAPPDSDSLKVHLFHLRKAIDGPFSSPLLHTIAGHGFALRADTKP
jgi:DNA-binding response OmpR family regulator